MKSLILNRYKKEDWLILSKKKQNQIMISHNQSYPKKFHQKLNIDE